MDAAEIRRIVTNAQAFGAQTVVFLELLRLLILNGVLDQTQVVAAYEKLSGDLMKEPGASQAIQLADLIRDYVAGQDRLPS
jgi:hypothetical protein